VLNPADGVGVVTLYALSAVLFQFLDAYIGE
jgi:hypothetical protein